MIQRGNSTLHRETSKIKRFYPSQPPVSRPEKSADDDWEESRHTEDVTKSVDQPDVSMDVQLEDTPPMTRDTPVTRTAQVVQPAQTRSEIIAMPSRRSARERRAPNMLGTWVPK